MEQGEEPSQRSLELTARDRVRQRCATHSRVLVADSGWRLPMCLINRPDLLSLDTGCAWGGALTAVRVDGGRRDVMQDRKSVV